MGSSVWAPGRVRQEGVGGRDASGECSGRITGITCRNMREGHQGQVPGRHTWRGREGARAVTVLHLVCQQIFQEGVHCASAVLGITVCTGAGARGPVIHQGTTQQPGSHTRGGRGPSTDQPLRCCSANRRASSELQGGGRGSQPRQRSRAWGRPSGCFSGVHVCCGKCVCLWAGAEDRRERRLIQNQAGSTRGPSRGPTLPPT